MCSLILLIQEQDLCYTLWLICGLGAPGAVPGPLVPGPLVPLVHLSSCVIVQRPGAQVPRVHLIPDSLDPENCAGSTFYYLAKLVSVSHPPSLPNGKQTKLIQFS